MERFAKRTDDLRDGDFTAIDLDGLLTISVARVMTSLGLSHGLSRADYPEIAAAVVALTIDTDNAEQRPPCSRPARATFPDTHSAMLARFERCCDKRIVAVARMLIQPTATAPMAE